MTDNPAQTSARHPVWSILWRLVVYGLLMVAIAQILSLDARQPVALKFSENTFTEWAQQTILALILGVFAISALRYPGHRGLSIALCGCAGIGLVREFNNFFKDQVFEGAWQLTALLLLGVTIWLFIPYRKHFLHNLRTIRGTFSEGMLIAGFITTFIFSRLFGRGTFWETLMGDRYFRSVKNAAEEGVELLGYSLLLIAAIEYYLLLKNHQRISDDH